VRTTVCWQDGMSKHAATNHLLKLLVISVHGRSPWHLLWCHFFPEQRHRGPAQGAAQSDLNQCTRMALADKLPLLLLQC